MALDEKRVAKKIRELNGNLAAVGRAFKVTRQSVHTFVKNNPVLLAICREARETMLDEAESSLYNAVTEGEGWAVCFFLKCQGKKRGYVEKEEEELRRKVAKLETIIGKLESKRRGERGTTNPS